MAGLIKRIIRKIIPQQERKCPACKRTLQKAVDEQLKEQKGCPLGHCAFKTEIQQAILESKTPEVVLWEIDKIQILESENITLSWEVTYAKKITISGLGEVESKGNRIVSPHQTTTYTLTIQDHKNNIYETENPINITVIPLPIIEIREENLKIERGNFAVLRWNASNVGKITLSLDSQTIDVSNFTEFTVQPNAHTIYKLTFIALDNKTTIEKELKVEVFPRPEIILFEVDPEVVISSIPVTISWIVKNAKRIEINNGVGEVEKKGDKTILHDKNTLYQITAWGELSSITKEIVVKVFPTPIIESLLVPMPDFESRINLNPILINPPQIDVFINMTELNLNLPQITEPDIDLQKIKPIYKKKYQSLTFQKYMSTSQNRERIMSLWQRAFIWCTAADIEAIKQCPSDWNKYSVIGATIFMTALIAGGSGGYFISYYLEIAYGMHGWTIPICFGILWAFLIFTLDRTIIVTMKKTGVFKEEFKQGVIRLILAIFIGIVIATPLELKMFESEIDAKINDSNRERNDFIVEQNELSRMRSAAQESEILEQKLKPLKEELSRLEKIKSDYDKADQERIAEAEGTGGTKKRGKGPVFAEKQTRFLEKKNNWEEVKEKYNSLQKEISDLIMSQNIQSNISVINVDDIKPVDGVEIRVKALYQLSGMHWFVTLLFILIECLPVISKLMSKRGCYDEVIDRIEYENMIEQKEIISRKNSEINKLLRRGEEAAELSGDVMIQMQKEKLEVELRNNKIILDAIAQTQQELALLAIEKWREEELAKVNSGKTPNQET